MNESRTCTKCAETKNLSEFRERKKPDGTKVPTTWCRSCLNECAKLSMRKAMGDPERREQHRESDRNRYERLKANPEFRTKEHTRGILYRARPEVKARGTEKSREWAKAHPLRMRELREKRYAANPAKHLEYNRRYRKKHTEKSYLQSVCSQGLRRWQSYNRTGIGRLTGMHVKVIRAYWGDRCAYCGEVTIPDDPRYHLDHVVPLHLGGSHSPDNVVVACKGCNCAKGRKLPPEPILELLLPHLWAQTGAMPMGAFYVGCMHPTAELVVEIAKASELVRGRGVPVGRWWSVAA